MVVTLVTLAAAVSWLGLTAPAAYRILADTPAIGGMKDKIMGKMEGMMGKKSGDNSGSGGYGGNSGGDSSY